MSLLQTSTITLKHNLNLKCFPWGNILWEILHATENHSGLTFFKPSLIWVHSSSVTSPTFWRACTYASLPWNAPKNVKHLQPDKYMLSTNIHNENTSTTNLYENANIHSTVSLWLCVMIVPICLVLYLRICELGMDYWMTWVRNKLLVFYLNIYFPHSFVIANWCIKFLHHWVCCSTETTAP